MPAPLCKGKTKDGKPCNAPAMANGYCYRHNPDISEAEKRQASASGRLSKAQREQLMADGFEPNVRSIDGLVSVIEQNMSDVRNGKIDPRTSNAVVQNLNVLLKVYELALTDTRLREIEKKVGIESPPELLGQGCN